MRMIDADKLQETLVKKKSGPANIKYTDGFNDALLRVKSIVHSTPTIDAVPVVRCRNCKHWLPRQGCSGCHHRSGLWEPQEDDYCSLGKRKEDEYGTD